MARWIAEWFVMSYAGLALTSLAAYPVAKFLFGADHDAAWQTVQLFLAASVGVSAAVVALAYALRRREFGSAAPVADPTADEWSALVFWQVWGFASIFAGLAVLGRGMIWEGLVLAASGGSAVSVMAFRMLAKERARRPRR